MLLSGKRLDVKKAGKATEIERSGELKSLPKLSKDSKKPRMPRRSYWFHRKIWIKQKAR